MITWREAELKFAEMMKNRGYEVEDVSQNSEYFDMDIDFIVSSPATGLVKTCEVKCDTRIHRTGNLFLETWSKYGNGLGWWNCCKADYLVYCDAENEIFYIFELDALRKRVLELPKEYKECGKDSIGQIISLKQVEKLIQTL